MPLEAAAESAVVGNQYEALTKGWLMRFHAEFPAFLSRADAHPRMLRSDFRVGVQTRRGFLEPRTFFPAPLDRARTSAAVDGARLASSIAAQPMSFLALAATPEVDGADLSLAGWEVIATAGGASLILGKRELGFGYGRSGGVVLSETALPQLSVETTRPWRGPGLLSVLGEWSLAAALSRFDERRHPDRPLFFTMQGTLRPHPRVTLSGARASMFAGDSTDVGITARSLGKMLIGVYEGTYAFENQVVSASVRYRLPTEALVPLTAYFEWGAEDSSGAWYNVPGRVIGIWSPALPGIPQVALGIEHTSFASSCCGNAAWYRHFSFRGGWATEDQALGHPLGGNGWEWTAYAAVDGSAAPVHADARFFARDREEENLFAPDRVGRSLGGATSVSWLAHPRVELRGSAFLERGGDWTAREFEIGTRILF